MQMVTSVTRDLAYSIRINTLITGDHNHFCCRVIPRAANRRRLQHHQQQLTSVASIQQLPTLYRCRFIPRAKIAVTSLPEYSTYSYSRSHSFCCRVIPRAANRRQLKHNQEQFTVVASFHQLPFTVVRSFQELPLVLPPFQELQSQTSATPPRIGLPLQWTLVHLLYHSCRELGSASLWGTFWLELLLGF